ncbi:fungal specific transcription factor [Hirsutella rhossiliensis]|uniref:Fungal specific transcription factor domain-containing protein n=1 Tax=Hirsutella rhossiliensis TaxID=111463 RepID=A0A9P8SP03_9HYPO|nr:fungal specific transcription factor domain-containing protein [Hirsutella rhossiliensis]KAH0968420.1 fungal specific transcription factor domain-containing protein [Hirsutella rhossiliensis]
MRLNNAALGKIYISGHNFGTFCTRDGIPQFTAQGQEWIFSRTGQWLSFQRLYAAENPPAPCFSKLSLDQASHGQRMRLPEEWIVYSLLKAFLASDFRLVFPMLDGVLFEDTIRLAYTQDTVQTLEKRSANACVFAFLSMVGPRRLGCEAARLVNGDACAAEAQVLLSDFLEESSITMLQTVLMLLAYETFSGRLQAASMYHAVACRCVFVLGGHMLIPSAPHHGELGVQDREDRQLRILFWVCYVFDKDIALRTGQPPIISDEFCDLTFPECTSSNNGFRAPWFPNDLRLSLLKSRVCRLLYSAPSLRQSDAELLRTIRELDEELESWRLSIPADFSPTLSVSEKHARLVADLDISRSMLHIELNLNYQYLMNAIHAASGSRSTLIYLSAAANRLVGEAFWVFVFYPVSALVTIFFSILRNPLDEQATQDVELLGLASNIIKSMPISQITAHEMAYLGRVDEFVAELGRLGKCAIAKSRNEAKEYARAGFSDNCAG